MAAGRLRQVQTIQGPVPAPQGPGGGQRETETAEAAYVYRERPITCLRCFGGASPVAGDGSQHRIALVAGNTSDKGQGCLHAARSSAGVRDTPALIPCPTA